jgi:endoglucanase
MYLVQKETTTDVGGGQDVGYIDTGSWMDYSVSPTSAGSYKVSFRVSTPVSSAKFELKNAAGTILATVSVPNTGGWQTWQTISATVNLPAGAQTLRIYSISPAWNNWNINWFELTPSGTATVATSSSSAVDAGSTAALAVSPSTTSGSFVLLVNNNLTGAMDVEVVDATGTVDRDYPLTKDATGTTQSYLSIADLASGTYTLKVSMGAWSNTTQIVKQ